MLDQISFKNYKSFKEEQTLEIKPMTILIGKNSSGKSAIAKLPVLIENSFENVVGEPFTVEYDDVQFGGEYRDLFYGRIPNAPIEFKLASDKAENLKIQIVTDFESNSIPRIINWQKEKVCNLVYNSTKNLYHDQISDGLLHVDFDGFNPINVRDENGNPTDFHCAIYDFKIGTDYIGPFRVYANTMRTFQVRSFRSIKKVGVSGEDAYHLLGVEALQSKSDIITSVSDWYKKNFDGWGIRVNTDLQPNYSVELTREDQKFNVNIADVGQGMSQALPLVVNAFIPDGPVLTIIEQPELHLHPAAHGNLAELFASNAIKLKKRYLIETHSQNFILRLRRLIAEGKFPVDDLRIYWVDYNEESNSSTLTLIPVNEKGEVSFWPENIFSEALDETIAIRRAQMQKEHDN